MSDARTVFEAFDVARREHGARPMLHTPPATAERYGTAVETLSYADAGARVNALAERYGAAGIGPGLRVALLLDNRPETFLHFLALNSAGASVVPTSSELVSAEIAYRFADSQIALVVALPQHHQLALQACRAARVAAPVRPPDAALPTLRAPAPRSTGEPGGEAAVLYTSGSTGEPKGCVLSNDYFMRMGRWYRRLGGYCELAIAGERLLTPLPLSHMNALACSFMGTLVTGGCLIQLDRFHPSEWWRTVRESGATIVHYLGMMPALLLGREPDPDERCQDRLKFGFGAGVDPRHHAAFELRFGFPLIEAWAMTETGAGAAIAAVREPRHVGERCFGRPAAEIEHRLIDEDGNDVPIGSPGELLVRATGAEPRSGFFSGYLGDEAATAAVWRGGWFHTGDVVRVDEQGLLFFVDRRKNLVRRSGENISALEVEAALTAVPEVLLAGVASVADETRGEEVMACVVPRGGVADGHAAANAIYDALEPALAYFKLPGWFAFVRLLPLTASEKLDRARLKLLCKALLEQGAAVDLRHRKRRRRA